MSVKCLEVGMRGSPHKVGVSALPGRKMPALYCMKNGSVKALAYFKGEEEANEFIDFCEYLIENGTSVQWREES